MSVTRKIVHIDMDAFYASVEQTDNPELSGKPVIVGGRPNSRGVVAACSYEARTFGIHSAMPCSRAYSLCPHGIFLVPRMSRYREISGRIMEILRQYSDLVEPVSLDEAYLDITRNKKGQPSATYLALDMCRHIREETGLTASAGVSCNKFVAKMASDINKPNGIAVIRPEEIPAFLDGLAIGKFHGVGTATERKMTALGIHTGADLRTWPLPRLLEHFGKHGKFFFDIVRGKDNRPVQPHRERKSIGAERTLGEDTKDPDEMRGLLEALAERVSETLHKNDTVCHTVTLKVRYRDFSTITRSVSSRAPLRTSRELLEMLPPLLRKTEAGAKHVRLLGVSVSNLVTTGRTRPFQPLLPFPPPSRGGFGRPDHSDPSVL